MPDKFNQEEAATAIKNATKEIENVCSSFKTLVEQVGSNFGVNGSSLGGTAGQLAQNSFETKSQQDFTSLNNNLTNFMNRVEEIVASYAQAASTVSTIYTN